MATVLPWRRTQQTGTPEEIVPILADYRQRRPKADTGLIVQAYRDAAVAHEGQSRRSGEPYIFHPLAVARILARLGLDDVTLAAALLHDAVEDTAMTLADLEKGYGEQV